MSTAGTENKQPSHAKKRIYICGPMTGLHDFNYPAFNAEAERLRALGYHVENPAENEHPEGQTWEGYMRAALRQMLTCDLVVMLDGWGMSRGARIEFELAIDLAIPLRNRGYCGDDIAS